MNAKYKKVLTYGRYLKQKYGCKVYKVPLNLSGLTCPNIDGTVAHGGCTFCQNDSFSPNISAPTKGVKKFTLKPTSKENPLLNKQLSEIENQYNEFITTYKYRKIGKYIAYFQSFTNTYMPFETIKTLYESALKLPDNLGLSIGTRSDSINDEILYFLKGLSEKHEIWVEFGVQSVNDLLLKKMNRGHDSANVEFWIKRAKKIGLNVCGHAIFGLYSESKDGMVNTIKNMIDWGIDSIKIHPLYVVERTILANEYRRGEFTPIDKELYIDTLVEVMRDYIVPNNIIVQRITAGNDILISPDWCRNKQELFRDIKKALNKENIVY